MEEKLCFTGSELINIHYSSESHWQRDYEVYLFFDKIFFFMFSVKWSVSAVFLSSGAGKFNFVPLQHPELQTKCSSVMKIQRTV